MGAVKPVVALDIDGTLGNWHEEFRQFAEKYLGKEISPYSGGPMYRWLGCSKTTYRQVKLAFRQSGLKRAMEPYTGASELTRSLRKRGAEVWICTTRPFLRLDNIDPDTRHWLRRNRIQYDGVLFGEHKYRDLVKIVGRGRVVGVLDDLPEMVQQARSVGLPGSLIIRAWNHAFLDEQQPSIGYIRDLPRAQGIFGWTIDRWKEANK